MPVQADEKTMAEPGEKIMEKVRGMKVHSGALDIMEPENCKATAEPEDQDGAGRTGGSDEAENQHSR